MVTVSWPAGRPQVEEVAGGVTVQPHEHVVRRGWSCRLLVREPNPKLPNVRETNMDVGEPANGLKLPNVRETNVEGMKEKWLLVTGVPESGHYRQGPEEKGGAVRLAQQQVVGMLKVLLVERGQLRHIARVSRLPM
ncbi:Hypothetical predicted protein [Pelobates cultripes]|uniref:Uncharacterized protein n=1 Tax=Pelobates cultripes TaxID=61616 RepID=A0AAD1RMT8_PELCU|nr:Hypothetical predicted protein [Pelobates cultripes]